jgi:hypothetical protein
MWMQDTCSWGMCVVVVYDVGCMWDLCTGCTFCVDLCGATALVLHAMWIYVGLLHCYMDVCGTFCIGCTCYVDICATNALAVHAMWFMWDYCIRCACYVDVCGATAHVVHARWMHMGPLHWLYVMWECTGYCQRIF